MRLSIALLLSMFCSLARAADPLPPIQRIFPPVGTKPDEATAKKLRGLVEELERDLKPFDPRGKVDAANKKLDSTLFADVAIYPKAVRFALDYDEFYKPTDLADAEKLLVIGRARLKELQDGVKEPSWTKQRGLVVRGYISVIDDSVQPYGLHIPEDLDLSKKPPLYVWLHGRQEKTLDLQFITERAKNKGKFAADDAITVHPFGRYNNAFKFAGERDVLDVMMHVENLYKTDHRRRVLMGFSMGGAGCWHIGAHNPNAFCAMAPGAGFSESRRFLKIKDDALPPWYEQVLWQWYDVPSYTRNLFNLPVIAYSGEKDGQKQAADVIEAEFAKHGKKLNHIIGPNMGHDYDKASLEKIRIKLKEITSREPTPRNTIYAQAPFAKYGNATNPQLKEITIPWVEAYVEISFISSEIKPTVSIKTSNVTAFSFAPLFDDRFDIRPLYFDIDGSLIRLDKRPDNILRLLIFRKTDGKWHESEYKPRENPGYEGTIDSAFCSPFVFVMPTGKCKTEELQKWVERESAYQIDRWRRTFRGDVIVIKDIDVKPGKIELDNVVLWGDEQSNVVIKDQFDWIRKQNDHGWKKVLEQHQKPNHIIAGIGLQRPKSMTFPWSGGEKGDQPASQAYFVLNSGPTFRDEHDRNNANQIPKLPDWAVIDVTTPGDAKSPGRVVAAGFFDNDWKYVDPAKQQAEFEARQSKK